jgi:chromosomal replication initiation ATPase DnaA
MNNCKNCQAPTDYRLGDIPLCFTCICQIEKSSSAEAIIKQAEIITGVSYELMRKRTRKRNIVDARRYTMKLLYEAGVGSLSFVGDLFGQDHSSVIAGIKKINELIETKQVRYGTNN